MKKLLLLIGAMLVLCTTAIAQVTTSSIGGYVYDQNRQPLVGATIEAVHTPTGTRYGVSADGQGSYRLRNLRPGGPYTVTITYLGYKGMEFTDITLAVADSRAINATLEEEAGLLEGVTVVANVAQTTDLAGSVTEISTRDINLMPTTSRSLEQLLQLTPQGNGQAIGGGTIRGNYVTVDGGSFNNMFGIGASIPSGGSPISIDAIEQMSVSLTPYDVRQSGFTGAAVNAVTRSGSNEFTGSAYTYWKTEKFRGLTAGSVNLRDRLTPSTYNLYGVRVGGPIIKDKLFFFANYENEMTEEPGPSRRVSPDGVANSGLNLARPTADRLKMMSDYLRNTYGYETGPYQGYSFDTPAQRILARLDWNINRNHTFNIRFSQTQSKYPAYPSTSISPFSSGSLYSGNRQSMSAMWYKNSGYYQEQNFTSLAAELNSSFGNIYNTLRFTYADQDEPRSTDGKTFPFVDIKQDNEVYTSFGTEIFSYGNLRKVKQFTISDDVTWTMGKHDFTAGAQYEHTNTKNGFMRMGSSFYVFDSWNDFVGGGLPSAFGITYSLTDGFKQQFPSFDFNQFTLYAQDQFNVNDRLTLTAGIRFDLPTYPSVPEMQTHPLLASLEFEGTDRKGGAYYDTGKMPESRVMFSPRVGFNWDVTGDRRYVLRGGSGIFTGRIPFVWIVAQSGDSGMLQFTQLYNGSDVPGPFNPDPLAYARPAQAGTTIPSTLSAVDSDFKMPQTWKSSLALDVQLPWWGLKGTVEGIYNRDLNPVHVYKEGLNAPNRLNVAGYPDDRDMYAYAYGDRYQHTMNSGGVLGSGSGYTYGVQPTVLTNAPFSKGGYYASLTAKIEKPFENGFSGMIAYTHSWAKSLNEGVGDQIGSVWSARNTVNGANSYDLGYAGYVIPNSVVASLSYRTEYAKHMATTISLFYTGGNGGRFSYTYSSNFVNDGGGYNLMYIPKDKSEIEFVDYRGTFNNEPYTWTAQAQSDAFWAYVDQDKYLSKHKGEYAERNGVVRPWESRFDLKVAQDFFIQGRNGKRNTLQLSVDVINFANMLHPYWGGSESYVQNGILRVANASAVAGGAKPTFNLVPISGTKDMISKTYTKSASFSDTYSFQLGVRYIFN